MKKLKSELRGILFFIVFTSKAQFNIRFMDNNGKEGVPVTLKYNSVILKSDMEGHLFLSKIEIKKYENVYFTLYFSEPLDGTVFTNKLYYSPGNSKIDSNIIFSKMKLRYLTRQKNNVFYMRRKSNFLDTDSSR